MKRFRIFLLAAIALYVAVVVVENLSTGGPFDWLNFAFDMFEAALLAAAVILTTFVSLQASEMQRERQTMIVDLDAAKREGDRWRAASRVHVDGLSRAIRVQFDLWQLTQAEEDVAVLSLNGLSHKEIGVLRATSEATVRQHAASVYRKSGLTNRAQLTAFFLEDLLAPSKGREAATLPLSIVKGESA